jgi:hypothetical protein
MPLIDLRAQATRRSPDELVAHLNDFELDHARIVEATMKPDAHRGWIEAYLIRRRSPHPERLPALEEALRTVAGS